MANATAPAILNALYHATGVRVRTIPATPDRVRAALLVAPANPARFQIAPERLADRLPFPATVVTSRNDPWFDSGEATQLAHRWGASTWDAGHVGHVNVASGHGPWPLAEALLETLQSTATQAWQPCPTPLSRPVSAAWVASA